MRRFLLLLTVFSLMVLFLFTLPAQEVSSQDEEDNTPEAGFFPIAIFLEAAEYAADGCWQPDWPLEIPPDAFTSVSDNWLSINVSLGEDAYCLRRNAEGLILEFPYLFQGNLVQVKLEYGDDKKQISKAKIFAPGTTDPFVEIEILQYSNNVGDYPYIIRVRQDALYSFVLLGRRQLSITEAWFDRDGKLSAVYEHRLIRVFSGASDISPRMKVEASELRTGSDNDGDYSMSLRSFDSRFFITGISGSSGEFTLSYSGEKFPRYLDRNPADVMPADLQSADLQSVDILSAGEGSGRYSYQWDKEGFLVRFSGIITSETGDDNLVESRYEYKFDSMGNWVERQETVMTRHFGYLAAETGALISRVLEYGKPL